MKNNYRQMSLENELKENKYKRWTAEEALELCSFAEGKPFKVKTFKTKATRYGVTASAAYHVVSRIREGRSTFHLMSTKGMDPKFIAFLAGEETITKTPTPSSTLTPAKKWELNLFWGLIKVSSNGQ